MVIEIGAPQKRCQLKERAFLILCLTPVRKLGIC